ncbi:MAG: L-threonylcarbamoyladenylate synthase [Mariprofundaceae bacterium]|nr:L-threonylcarbamoyladenylate synthase [Mariprofundaceae bacterium]
MHIYERLRLHPDRPQIRQIRRAAELLRQGLFAVVPTDTTYAMMALPGSLDALGEIRMLRDLDDRHLWALVCSDLSQAARYAQMDNSAHRILKRSLPGPFTFILPASSQLSKRVFGKRRDIGIRIPEHGICQMLLEELGQPLLTTSMQLPGEEHAVTDPDQIHDRVRHLGCVMMDVGWCGMIPSTVIDLCGDAPEVLRHGLGEWGG